MITARVGSNIEVYNLPYFNGKFARVSNIYVTLLYELR